MGVLKGFPGGGLRRRWLLNSLGLITVIVTVSVTVSTLLISNYYFESLRATMETRARQTSGFFDKYYNESYEIFYSSAQQWALEFKDKDKLELQFIGVNGRVDITSSGAATNYRPQTPDVRDSLETGRLQTFEGTDPLTGERVMSVSAPLTFGGSQVIGVMRFVSSLSEVDNQIMRSFWLAMLIGLTAIAFVAFTNILFIRGIVHPLQEINQVTKRIAAGSYGARIEKSFSDEIGELADNINHMSSEINISNRLRTDFMSSVSHELRTPLTAISGWGETLLAPGYNNPDELKQGIRIMLNEATRLTRLVEDLLEFTRMEGGRMTLYSEPMDLTAELDEVVAMMKEGFRKDGIAITYEKENSLPAVIGDKARLKQVIFNILDNAAKHGGEGKRIDVAVTAEQHPETDDPQLCVTIRDHGAGIPEDELPHVKMRFYKGASRARGHGIGLSVSDEIVRLHDGTLDIESQPGAGTTVYIRLPAQRKEI